MVTIKSIEEKAKAYDEAIERARVFKEHLLEINEKDYADEMIYIFPELKESEDERIRKEMIDYFKSLLVQSAKEEFNDLINNKFKKYISWLENQGEQKPADKVKPKFKVGDWIINSQGTLRHIINVGKGSYRTNEGWLSHETYEKTFHLWTIQDAKVGDVLSYRNGQWIFIYKEKIDDSSFYYHTLYSTIHQDLIIDDIGFTLLDDAIVPATKEQRELLFQKMKEAGYKWDAEKKELKKISQEYPLTPDECIKPSWSEEDEERYLSCLKRLSTGNPEQPETINSKWFKEHVYYKSQWKPSESQMKWLHDAIESTQYEPRKQALVSLYSDLMELKE